jgi:hypothetical protein
MTMVKKARAFLDKHVERFISRKFLAWATATGLCYVGTVTSSDWVAVTLAYIGSQALVDLATQWKTGSKSGRDIVSEEELG